MQSIGAENGSGGTNTDYPAASLNHCLEGSHPGVQSDKEPIY